MPRPIPQDSYSSLRRAFVLLDSFTADRDELSIRELARVSGVPRSTTHRLVQELMEWGALEQGRSGMRLGVKLFELGARVSSPASLRDVALPYAHNLNEVTKLTVNLAVREGSDIVYVEKISTRSLRVPHSRLGGRLSLHATGLGKAILAFSDAATVGAVLEGELPALTPRTISDPQTLLTELATVRRLRIAYDLEESQLGLFCVAAPILSPRDEPIAAISVTGARAHSQAELFAPAVQMTALAIARALHGGRH
ncbi:IclR family transcriptional regulator [Compostimonas suwonensis]|nr:IclR family transcriptional regulator [Compostimonas suwonensis]